MLEVLALRFIAPNSHSITFGKTKHAKIHDFLELSRFTDEAFKCTSTAERGNGIDKILSLVYELLFSIIIIIVKDVGAR